MRRQSTSRTTPGNNGRTTTISSSRQRGTPIAGPYSAEKTGVIIIAAPKPGEAAHHACNDGNGGAIRKGRASRSGIRESPRR